MDNDIKKRFPADTSLDKMTFLNNKHINGELYAYLQSLSTVRYNQNKDEYYTDTVSIVGSQTIKKYNYDVIFKRRYILCSNKGNSWL